jgi:methionine sulfoxide reductase heme-binding subunit
MNISAALRHKFAKPLFFTICLLPFIWIIAGIVLGNLGANPVETITHQTGDWALRLLILTLVLTPLKNISGINQFIRFRRMAGLFVYFYAFLHFSIWFLADHGLDVISMYEDIIKRPYITLGFIAFSLLTPLALTSNRWSIGRLGKNWKVLHKLVYPILLLAVIHYLWLVKADYLEPVIYAVIALIVLAARLKPVTGFKNSGQSRAALLQSRV